MKQDLDTQNQLLFKKLEIMDQEFKFFHYGMISSNVLFTTAENEAANGPASPPTLNTTQSTSTVDG